MGEPQTYRRAEVLRLTGLTVRAIRHYVQVKLVTGAKARGPATVYTREQLVRLQVIALLRRRDRLSIPKIRKRIATLSLPELEAMLPKAAPPPPRPATVEPLAASAQRFDRVELVPGLELCVRTNAGPLVQRLAREIVASYGTDAADPAKSSSNQTTSPGQTA
jgi:DNA-binding transcriptional MerR regulator